MKTKTPYKPRKVQLANGQTGIILIPGLDACLVGIDPNPHEHKIWAITDWDYQRRLNLLNSNKAKKTTRRTKVKEVNPMPPILGEESKWREFWEGFRQNPDWEEETKKVTEEEILPEYMKQTRILKYLD